MRIGSWEKQHNNTKKQTIMQWTNFAPMQKGLGASNLLYSWDKNTKRFVKLSSGQHKKGAVILGYFHSRDAVRKDAVKLLKSHPRG